jgi:hypothetical protein
VGLVVGVALELTDAGCIDRLGLDWQTCCERPRGLHGFVDLEIVCPPKLDGRVDGGLTCLYPGRCYRSRRQVVPVSDCCTKDGGRN